MPGGPMAVQVAHRGMEWRPVEPYKDVGFRLRSHKRGGQRTAMIAMIASTRQRTHGAKIVGGLFVVAVRVVRVAVEPIPSTRPRLDACSIIARTP